MKGHRSGLALFALAAFAGATLSVATAFATPTPNSAFINLRVFNDCPVTTLNVVNNYPGDIIIDETDLLCVGGVNLHTWSYSDDGGLSAAQFPNNSAFKISALVTLSGAGNGEGGMRISPWWSQHADGKFMLNATSGEIAVFGGRLPFYSFTVNHGVTYTKGNTAYMEALYLPNGLSMASPARVEYRLVYGGNFYTSGPLAFDQGTVAEDPPHGLWGILNFAAIGGYLQPSGSGVQFRGEWSDIKFENLDPVDVAPTTWGRMKGLYR